MNSPSDGPIPDDVHTPPSSASEPPFTADSPGMMLIGLVAVGGLVGLGLSGYLSYVALNSGSLVGCGQGVFRCDEVLQSRWSKWNGLPVSFAAVSIYLSLLGILPFTVRQVPATIRTVAWTLVTLLSLSAAGAAIWFIGLQVLVIGKVCVYCLAAHACGLFAAGCCLAGFRKYPRAGRLPVAFLGAGGAWLLLIAGQLTATPTTQTYAVRKLQGKQPVRILEAAGPTCLTFLDKQVVIRPGDFPAVGSPQAKLKMIKLFDYTCVHCQALHRQLAEISQQDATYVIRVPLPIDPACNPMFREDEKIHPESCRLAKLALAVWLYHPDTYPAFDHWLFQSNEPPEFTRAVQEANALLQQAEVEAPDWEELMEGEQVTRRIRAGRELYQFLGEGLIPQLLLTSELIEGEVESLEDLRGLLKRNELR